jgi:hypothetical protein
MLNGNEKKEMLNSEYISGFPNRASLKVTP